MSSLFSAWCFADYFVWGKTERPAKTSTTWDRPYSRPPNELTFFSRPVFLASLEEENLWTNVFCSFCFLRSSVSPKQCLFISAWFADAILQETGFYEVHLRPEITYWSCFSFYFRHKRCAVCRKSQGTEVKFVSYTTKFFTCIHVLYFYTPIEKGWKIKRTCVRSVVWKKVSMHGSCTGQTRFLNKFREMTEVWKQPFPCLLSVRRGGRMLAAVWPKPDGESHKILVFTAQKSKGPVTHRDPLRE